MAYLFPEITYTHGNQIKLDSFPKTLNKDIMEIFGYWVGDGWYSGYSWGLVFFGGDTDVLEHFDILCTQYLRYPYIRDLRLKKNSNAFEMLINNISLVRYCRETLQLNKHQLPAWIMAASDAHKAAFLRGFFEADGCIFYSETHRSPSTLSAVGKSPILMQGIRTLLGDLGVESRSYILYVAGVPYTSIYIPSYYRRSFQNKIGFISDRKQKLLDIVCTRGDMNQSIKWINPTSLANGENWYHNVKGNTGQYKDEEAKEFEDEFSEFVEPEVE